jgi:MFS family permease
MIEGTVMTLGRPARQAILPALVPHAAFPNAIMWNSSMFQISSVAGPAVGGLIVAFSLPAAYLTAAAGAVVMFVAMLLIHVPYVARPRQAPTFGTVLEGLTFLKNNKIVLAAISLDMFAVLLGGADYLLPIYAADLLGGSEVVYGWLRAAPAVGALCMALILAHTPPMKHAGRMMLWAVVGFGVATVVFGVSRNLWLSMAMLFLIGAFDNISVVVRHTLVQVLTPDSMRGRVSAVNGVFISASNELGGLESGVVASAWNPVGAVVSGGLGTMLSVALIAACSPGLRKFGRLEDAKAEDETAPANGDAKQTAGGK